MLTVFENFNLAVLWEKNWGGGVKIERIRWLLQQWEWELRLGKGRETGQK